MRLRWRTLRRLTAPPPPPGQTEYRYRASPDVTSAAHGEKLVLLDLRFEQYYSLDGIGARIWELIGQSASADEITAKLAAEYEAPLDQIRQDVNAFVADLVGSGLAREV